MIHRYCFNGLQVSTGDILCTRDGEEGSLFGQFWNLLGKVVPGEVDHCLVYIGPGGRCVESGPKGVIIFEMPGEIWDSRPLFSRRWILDTFYGAAYPLAKRGLSISEEERIRLEVAAYCLELESECKPYNLNFFNPQRDGAFYCSQLVYRAYLAQGIDLNTNQGVPAGVLGPIVFPQEIWNACEHKLAEKAQSE
jgi:hypothetical protein